MFHQKFNNDDRVSTKFTSLEEEHEHWITWRKLFRKHDFVQKHVNQRFYLLINENWVKSGIYEDYQWFILGQQ